MSLTPYIPRTLPSRTFSTCGVHRWLNSAATVVPTHQPARPLSRLSLAPSSPLTRPSPIVGPLAQRPHLDRLQTPLAPLNPPNSSFRQMSTKSQDPTAPRAPGTSGTLAKLPAHTDLITSPNLGPIRNSRDARKWLDTTNDPTQLFMTFLLNLRVRDHG